MCLICVDLEKDKMTWKEARQILSETYTQIPKEHTLEILKLIWKKEDEEFQKHYLSESIVTD